MGLNPAWYTAEQCAEFLAAQARGENPAIPKRTATMRTFDQIDAERWTLKIAHNDAIARFQYERTPENAQACRAAYNRWQAVCRELAAYSGRQPMKLVVRKPGLPERTVEGAEARHEFREALMSIGQSIMLPEWPYTGKIWIRVKQRLQRGEPIWTHPGRHGEATRRSTILRVPVTNRERERACVTT